MQSISPSESRLSRADLEVLRAPGYQAAAEPATAGEAGEEMVPGSPAVTGSRAVTGARQVRMNPNMIASLS